MAAFSHFVPASKGHEGREFMQPALAPCLQPSLLFPHRPHPQAWAAHYSLPTVKEKQEKENYADAA